MLGLSPVLLRESLARASDPAGAVTATATLAVGLYAVVTGPEAGWASVHTLGLLAVSAALVAVFIGIESRSVAPLMPLGTFSSRTFTGGNLLTLLTGMTAFGMPLMVSQYAQRVLGYSPLTFGIGTAVMPVMAAVGSYAGQSVVTRIGHRPVGVAGMGAAGRRWPAARAGLGRWRLSRRPWS